jgi:hypothetical protein
MAKSPNTLAVTGFDLTKVFRGQQQYLFFEGADAYTKTRTGAVTLDDGTTKIEAEVRSKFVGSLFNLVRDYGRESMFAAGTMFDPSMIFDILEDNGQSIDPRAVYTAVAVIVSTNATLA